MNIRLTGLRALFYGFVISVAACDATSTEPLRSSDLKPSASATSTLAEFPVNVNFQFFSACLNAPVMLSGTAYWSVRTVVKPDGSRHLTILMDVSGPTLSSGGSVWTAHEGASEMFVRNIPAGGVLGVDDQQTEHQGTVIYKSADGRPDLRFLHRIHLVRLPGTDEVQINHNIFGVVCVGQNS
jgi:hypothetical protein